ncbi:MAG: sigma-70 family RNA polymerase sigma factor [bacterium]|nr:sigma-70 family RNA polymerase sigma factor [bacterium]
MIDPDSLEIQTLLSRAIQGDAEAFAELLTSFRPRLERLIELRMDKRMLARLDVADVIQEVHLAGLQKIRSFCVRDNIPFYVWLRAIALNKLRELHRRHLTAQKRSAANERSLALEPTLGSDSAVLARQFADSATSPSVAAMRQEVKVILEELINQLPAGDREIIALRHFEQLNPTEAASILGISDKAAGMRYMRALRKFKELINDRLGDISSAIL